MTNLPSTSGTRTYEGLTVPEAGTFALDPAHTSVNFVVRHLMVAKVRGHFSQYTGTVTVGEDPLSSSVTVEVQVASVSTGDDQRDGHLKSPDFFDVERHPTITFAGSQVSHQGGDRFTVDGELTVHGVARPVQLEVEYSGAAQDPWGNQRIGFSARAEVNREDFGLTWNQALEAGGVLVGKTARIEIDAEAVRQG